jgi:hypothetical protein
MTCPATGHGGRAYRGSQTASSAWAERRSYFPFGMAAPSFQPETEWAAASYTVELCASRLSLPWIWNPAGHVLLRLNGSAAAR